MDITPNIQTFVQHFGHMGSRWGINRTVGQVYALLFLAKEPLNADQIVEALKVSRSNVAMSLKELSSMNLLMLKHIPGDRKDYYVTHEDIWDIVRNLVEERRKREVQPTLTVLRDIIMSPPSSESEAHAQDRMREMHDVIEMLTNWYTEMQHVDNARLVSLMKLGAKIFQLFQLKDKLMRKSSDDDTPESPTPGAPLNTASLNNPFDDLNHSDEDTNPTG